jgi:hypothetical protein
MGKDYIAMRVCLGNTKTEASGLSAVESPTRSTAGSGRTNI